VAAGPSQRVLPEGISFALRDVSRPGPGLVSATAVYQAAGQVWTQSFTARLLTEQQLRARLAEVGLEFDCYLTDDRSWLRVGVG
jgi:hypothetical protein